MNEKVFYYPVGAMVHISSDSHWEFQIERDESGKQIPLFIVGIRMDNNEIIGRYNRGYNDRFRYATSMRPDGPPQRYYNQKDLYWVTSSGTIQNADLTYLLKESFESE